MEDLAHLWFHVMRLACGDASVGFECLVFDPFSFQQDGLAPAEVDISRCEVGDAFVVSQMVVVADEVTDLLLRDRRADNSSRAGCGS